MNVTMLTSLFLKKLGHSGTDIEYPDTAKDYAPEALVYLNEGYFKAMSRVRPIKEESVKLDGLCCFDPAVLSLDLVLIRYILRDGRRIRTYVPGGREMGDVFVPGARAEEVVVVGYEFDPPPLCEDADEPMLKPAYIHGMIADYAAARVLEGQGKLKEASSFYAAFERGILLAKPARGPMQNKFDAWYRL